MTSSCTLGTNDKQIDTDNIHIILSTNNNKKKKNNFQAWKERLGRGKPVAVSLI